MKGLKTIERAARTRLDGGQPSRTQAAVSGAVAGAAVAVTVYKVLRS